MFTPMIKVNRNLLQIFKLYKTNYLFIEKCVKNIFSSLKKADLQRKSATSFQAFDGDTIGEAPAKKLLQHLFGAVRLLFTRTS